MTAFLLPVVVDDTASASGASVGLQATSTLNVVAAQTQTAGAALSASSTLTATGSATYTSFTVSMTATSTLTAAWNITDPRDIPGLTVWYSADAETGYIDGQVMTQWTDLSGNNNHATPSASAPQYSLGTGQTGGPSIKHDTATGGVRRYWNLPDIFTGLASAEVLLTLQGISGQQSGFWRIGSATGGSEESHYTFSGSIYDTFGLSIGKRQAITPTMTTNVWRRYNVYAANNDWQAFLDGVSQRVYTAGGTPAWISTPLLGVGYSTVLDLPFKGFVGTFVAYNRKLGAGERLGLNKWAEANPSGGTSGPVVPVQNAAAALTASATLTMDAAVERFAGAALVSTATLSAAGVGILPATSSMTATATLTAGMLVTRPATAAMTAVASLSTTAVRTVLAGATLSAASTLSAAAVISRIATASLTASGTLTVSSVVLRNAAAALTGTSTLSVSATRVVLGSISLTSTSTLNASGSGGSLAASTALTASASLTVSGSRVRLALAALTASSTLTSTATRGQPSVLAMVAAATLTATGFTEYQVSVLLEAVSILEAAGVGTSYAGTLLEAVSTLTALAVIAAAADKSRYVRAVLDPNFTWAALDANASSAEMAGPSFRDRSYLRENETYAEITQGAVV